MRSVKLVSALALAATFAVATTVSANAECKRYGFTVNDYGKDGPTRDAKDLLDKLIQTKMAERGVSDYRTGKKSVTCELFLNLILFDEHTCTAEATVCWGGSVLPRSEQQSAVNEDEPAEKTAADAAPAPEKPAKKAVTKQATGQSDTAAPAARKTASQPVPDPKSVLTKSKKSSDAAKQLATAPHASAEATAAEATVEPIGGASRVETGSLPDVPAKSAKHKAAVDSPATAPAKADVDAGDDAGYPTPLPPQEGDVQ